MTDKILTTECDDIENDLIISGYSGDDVAALTAHLASESLPVTHEWLFYDARLQIVHSVCPGWLIRRLRRLAEGNNPEIAVAALAQLVKISIHGQYRPGIILPESNFIFNKRR
ncbi:hypothetical protein ZY50_21765 [Salmonella enterica subsp. enterica]|nr:hypothetical protein [Salmonella enterica subsp. enterica serovar Newport]ECA9706318.1 hypothetical protein [Salmonella enterica subsp. enterica serovar Bredeney]EEB7956584.1 hypothetical protein [Salmonella enterica subsp. enterica serovar Newport]EEH2755689.1 hypothetical protein [Salmonella enterica subsp. enterica serovar Enteritidis]